MADNLFLALSQYKKPEDFLTAAFLWCLETLHKDNPGICSDILTKLCLLHEDTPFTSDEKVKFRTQLYFRSRNKKAKRQQKGRVDAVIESDSKLIYIEVKDRARVGPRQIEKYREALREHAGHFQIRRLILLRNIFIDPNESEAASKSVHWAKVYQWLLAIKPEVGNQCLSSHILEHFLKFLEWKGVTTMRKITDINELEKGIPSFGNLLTMIGHSIRELVNKEPDCDLDLGKYMGLLFKEGKVHYSIGLRFDNPTELRMYTARKGVSQQKLNTMTYAGNLKIDPDYDDEVYVLRPLQQIINKSDEEQANMIGSFIKDMYDELKDLRRRR